MAEAYLFLNYNYILAYDISFSNTLCSNYRSNQPIWKIPGIASINFDCFAIDESNQVKMSREIMRYQGYLLKIALGTWLYLNLTLTNFHVDCTFRYKFCITTFVLQRYYSSFLINTHGISPS